MLSLYKINIYILTKGWEKGRTECCLDCLDLNQARSILKSFEVELLLKIHLMNNKNKYKEIKKKYSKFRKIKSLPL